MCPTFSKLIKSTLQRKAVRVKLDIPAEITQAPRLDDGIAKTALLSDLSITGGFIAMDRQLGEPGEEIALSFMVRLRPDHEERLAFNATIQSVRRMNTDHVAPLFAHGVQFKRVNAADRAMLQNFVYTSIKPFQPE